jgi:hypothetical protein
MSSDASPSKEELLALLRQERERADYERKRAEQAEERNWNTTFAEYLRACHCCITKPLTIQTNRSLTTKGSVSNPASEFHSRHPACAPAYGLLTELEYHLVDVCCYNPPRGKKRLLEV